MHDVKMLRVAFSWVNLLTLYETMFWDVDVLLRRYDVGVNLVFNDVLYVKSLCWLIINVWFIN